MKQTKFWSLLAFCFCLAGALTFTACGDDDDNTPQTPDVPNTTTGITVDDLVGTWTLAGQDVNYTYTFTQTHLTIKDGTDLQFDGDYTLKDDVLTYNTTADIYNSETGKYESTQVAVSQKLGLLYDKTVLVFKDLVKNDNEQYYEFSVFMYKQGATINAKLEDIQGTWHWYMHGDTTYVRTSLKIEGNKFDMVITPWGQRYTGTFTYTNGIMTLNTEKGYTSREEGSGDGWGEGDLDPETLEGTWKRLDDWMIWEKMPFIVNGTEAYGMVANLYALFYKM